MEYDNIKQNVSQNAYKNIVKWLSEPKYQMYKAELEQLIANEKWQELEDAFFKVLEFGTAGRRGVAGIGSNRMNKVTVGESAQGLCEYAQSVDERAPQKGIVIAYDTRLTSPELSRYAAQVCAANGFKTYLFDGFRATPELSFAVRHLGAAAGIVISASHNPPSDNGFKAYWSDGGQLVSPHDKGVMEYGEKVTQIHDIEYEYALEAGTIELIGDEVDTAYIQAIAEQAEGNERGIHIVYSPLHGTGQRSVLPALKHVGFSDISVVEAQMTPDGNFPTVPNNRSNPEDRPANDMAVAQLLEEKADIALTNDPDADRIGVMVRQGDEVVYLSGNQSAVLAADYILSKQQAKNGLTPKHYLAKTIVTTDMLNAIADKYNVNVIDNLLIGFKYIGEVLLEKEGTDEVFVMGGEESFGMLKGTYARDKDGATGALPLAEYAAELKKDHKTLYDRLIELFAEHGIYTETLTSVFFYGADGFQKMQNIMTQLRDDTPVKLAGYEVSAVQDFTTLKRTDVKTNEETDINCIKGNVLVFELGDKRRRITIRPSGTEPKLKFYIQWFDEAGSKNSNEVREQYQKVQQELNTLVVALKDQITNS